VKGDRIPPATAIASISSVRPGSVGTAPPEAGVHEFAVALAAVQARPLDWLIPGRLAACVNPAVGELAAAELETARVGLLINLHERPDPRDLLERLGAETLHLPVQNSDPPSPRQLEQGVAAISEALARGTRVAVHCAAGLGRTGTLLAAYLVSQGSSADEAIARVRAVRPGSVETLEQEQAVHDFARRIAPG
jgi:atypical dual specificity phosphatase